MTWLYTPYYCEENVWHLSRHRAFCDKERKVVFISNKQRACPLWRQRAAPSSNEPVFWDYHVILLCRDSDWQVWDLDTLMGMPVDVATYVRSTFSALPPDSDWAARLKLIDAGDYAECFSSDRSHMRTPDGQWLAPPPAWPPILPHPQSNLNQFIDMDDRTFGEVLTLEQFNQRFARPTEDEHRIGV